MRLASVMAMVLFLAAGVAAGAAAEDKLHLKDGQVITGKILEETRSDIQIETAEETIRVPMWAIEKIERAAGETSEPGAAKRATPGRTAPKRGKTPSTMPVPRSPKATEEMLRWVDLCVQHLGSSDRGVRAGAAAALRAAGSTARPALERLAAGEESAAAPDAKRLLAQLERAEARLAERRKPQKTRTDLMIEALKLDSSQAKAVKSILQDYHVKQRTLAQSIRNGDVEAARAAELMNTLGERRDTRLSKVLTKKQMQGYLDDWATEKKNENKGR